MSKEILRSTVVTVGSLMFLVGSLMFLVVCRTTRQDGERQYCCLAAALLHWSQV